MSENNEASVEANCFRGGFTLKASRLGGAVLRPALLGDSVLGSAHSNTNTNANSTNNNNNNSIAIAGGGDGDGGDSEKTEAEGIIGNPFLREQKEEMGEEEAKASADATAVAESTEKSDKDDDDENIDERPDPLSMLRNNGIDRTNIFAAAQTNMPRVQTSGFIFGQNVHERVVGENLNSDGHAEATVSGSAEASSSQLLFSTVIQQAAHSSENNKETSEAKSLNDVAREYEESRAQKRKYEEVETFTGEENEINIADVSCKLFAFVNSNWEERGRGSLRLNDAKDERDCSRVVFRTSGNLRLLLNTKVWAAMVAERASQKSLRLTAMDNTGTVKIFCAMGRPADIAQLHKALSERIAKRKQTHPDECAVVEHKNGLSTEACTDVSVRPESTTNDDDDDDDVAAAEEKPAPSSGAVATTAEADSNEPRHKKALMQADSSCVDVAPAEDKEDGDDAEVGAEAEPKQDENA